MFTLKINFWDFFWCVTKGIVFFFSPEKFVFVHFWRKIDWMNENTVFYFFRSRKKKNNSEIEWMNDMWTFPWKEKNTQKTDKTAEKKKYNQLLLKKRGLHKNPNEWPINFSWEIKKNKSVFFFSRSAEKKNTIFGFEWMNDQRPCPRKKKNTVPLEIPYKFFFLFLLSFFFVFFLFYIFLFYYFFIFYSFFLFYIFCHLDSFA